jgi:hypothetical protein
MGRLDTVLAYYDGRYWLGSPAPIGYSGGCLERHASIARWSARSSANSAGGTCSLSASGGLTQSRQLDPRHFGDRVTNR